MGAGNGIDRDQEGARRPTWARAAQIHAPVRGGARLRVVPRGERVVGVDSGLCGVVLDLQGTADELVPVYGVGLSLRDDLVFRVVVVVGIERTTGPASRAGERRARRRVIRTLLEVDRAHARRSDDVRRGR